MEKPLRGLLTRSKAKEIAAVLCNGGVVVLPTDTLYGFHCLATRLDAVRRVRKLKEEGKGKAQVQAADARVRAEKRSGFILLASDIKMVDRLVSRWPRDAQDALTRIWPAPLTAILPASKRIDRTLAPRGKVAVRIPALPELRSLVKLCGQPLVSTSVNITGFEPMTRISEIMRAFPGLAAYISQRGRPSAKPSTIVDMTASPPKLLRPGRYPWPLR